MMERRHLLFVLEGHTPQPVEDIDDWAKRFNWHDRNVANHTVDDILVSTVFLGVNHNYGDGPPLVFETMVFGGPHDGYCERYSTWEEAEEGHRRTLLAVRVKLNS